MMLYILFLPQINCKTSYIFCTRIYRKSIHVKFTDVEERACRIFLFVYSGHELNIIVIQTQNAFIVSRVINMNSTLLLDKTMS